MPSSDPVLTLQSSIPAPFQLHVQILSTVCVPLGVTLAALRPGRWLGREPLFLLGSFDPSLTTPLPGAALRDNFPMKSLPLPVSKLSSLLTSYPYR